MSFVASRTYVVAGAVTSQYTVEHPLVAEGNYQGDGTLYPLYPHIEIANMTGDLVFVAFDRPVVPPSGNGVQGVFPQARYPRTGPMAATPGDFDFVISSANGWGALDITVKSGSKFMSVYTRTAGSVAISYGDQM